LGIPFSVIFISPHLRQNVLFFSASHLIPITLAMVAMDLLQHRKFEWSAFVLGLSAVAKLLPAVVFALLLFSSRLVTPDDCVSGSDLGLLSDFCFVMQLECGTT
jgi:hypothetical protein